ncbi:glycosyltransferase [Salinihabitans flavidus]|nr:glycosyltransferase [Salinihabitans flavidus]
MNWHNGLRRKLGSVVHGFRGFRGHVDGFQNGEILGWVARSDGQPGQHLTVGVYTAKGLVTQATANMYRGDLKAAGIGNGNHGFCIPLSDSMLRSIAEQGGVVRLRTLGGNGFNLGRFRIPKETLPEVNGTSRPSGKPATRGLQELLYGDLEALADLVDVVRKHPPPHRSPPFAPHAEMFAATDYIHGGALPAPMTAYAEYVRYRYKLDTPFPIQEDPENVAHFLSWYIAGYGPLRKGLRVPMSREMIDWLNMPVVIGGVRHSFTQIHWSFLMGVPPILHSMDFNNSDWVLWAVYWWSIDQAKALHCEDVLVPQTYIDLLSAIPPSRADQPWPLTAFMIRKHAQTEGLSTLNLDTEDGRRRLLLALLVMAVQRPDYLRYLPSDQVSELLEPDETEQSPMARFVADLGVAPDSAPLDRALFSDMLRLRGFDLETGAFVTTDTHGHRFEAAMLPPVETEDEAEIQLIGPFKKASGLGQATRLSAAVLDHAGYRVNPVNFGLDNPAPEGFSSTGQLSDWQRAKINLIHLNAESIPLIYAYAPDVFSGAYNIGYFFWELDTPAACHFLGMELLDEIWVSTDYGVQIYDPHNGGRPVTNVGMCFEHLPEIEREDARRFVCDRFGFKGDEFVFLVAFDSFSFVQRKNPVGTLKAFRDAFEGVQDVRLVIKTQNRTKVTDPVQEKIWEEVDAVIAGDDRFSILDETLKYEDLLRLKAGSDCYISLHKSEGWGFGMIEAMNLKVPVVATAYSGNMDFCSDDTAWLVDYKEVALEPDEYIFVRPGQKWAEPDHADAVRQMRAVHDDETARTQKAEAAWRNVQENFSAAAIAKRYRARLDEIMKTL